MNKKVIFGILISVVLVYLSVRGINFNDVWSDLKKIQLTYVILFLLLVILMQYLRSYRWGVILQPMEKIDQLSLFSVTSVGFLAIAAIPARIGELARPYLISKRSSIKMSSALGTIIVERILDSFTVLSIAVIVLLKTDLPSWMIQSSILFFLIAMALFCFVLFLILRREKAMKFINIILDKLPGKFANKIDEILHHFINGLQIVTNVQLLLYLFFLSVMIWLLDVLTIYVLLLSFGFSLPVMASFVVMIILIVGIAIPTAPGFIGNWHFACILALSFYGLSKPDALSFAVVYHFLSMVVLVVFGIAFLPFNKFSISEMTKQMNHE
ncbi:MAG TPA: lysylphosphatidylglycerol synthase transmembrane domain-containing protein [Smithella sp.]|nr:flippase-like domain-containing protein [Smithella sp.]MDM7988593.1 lysylphosphatidylglycerol synthase transmembrane domain-containing protein [Smithella sp.]HNY49676.1 lysylphosphatidylglycerol synthase transmembrane domain-containing protein [Smithella sp.]HOG89278.1 lysylphosphatidylglycerol synthase transmembrane domain-containing protein [Smithella sp.]HOU50836.1 lysylphosphatidylglycerol synthase transmembrane domain-containing protein [Smithella sp.]